MNSWITNWNKLKIKVKKILKKQTNLQESQDWKNCPQCKKISYLPDLIANSYICECSFHFDFPLKERFKSLFDSDYEILESKKNIDPDPLKFEVTEKYKYIDKIKKYRETTGSFSALTSAYGKMSNLRAVISIFDPRFGAGRMGPVENENYLLAAEFASREKVDLWVVVFQSSGIDVHTGIVGLAGMPKTIIAMNTIKAAKIPTFAVAARAVAGGTYASVFFQHEFIIIESNCVQNLLFSGLRVTSNILKSADKIPENFGRADGIMESGLCDIVLESRNKLKETISRLAKIILKKSELNKEEDETTDIVEKTSSAAS